MTDDVLVSLQEPAYNKCAVTAVATLSSSVNTTGRYKNEGEPSYKLGWP